MLYVPPSFSTDANASYVGKIVAAGKQGSKVPPGALEYPQREIQNAIVSSGQAPTNNDLFQLWKAIQAGAKTAVLPYTVAGARKSRAYTQYALTNINGAAADNIAQTLALTGVSYIDALAACSIFHNNVSGDPVNVAMRADLYVGGQPFLVGDIGIGATILPKTGTPLVCRQIWQNLNPAVTYTIVMMVQQGGGSPNLNVNNAYLVSLAG